MRGEESYRRVTREKYTIQGNTTYRTMHSTTSFLPVIDRYVQCTPYDIHILWKS